MRIPPGPPLSTQELRQIFFANPFPFFDECKNDFGKIFTLDLGNFGCKEFNSNGLWVFVCGEENNKLLSQCDPHVALRGAGQLISFSIFGPMQRKALLFQDGDRGFKLRKDILELVKHYSKRTISPIKSFDDNVKQSLKHLDTQRPNSLSDFVTKNVYTSLFESVLRGNNDDHLELESVLLKPFLENNVETEFKHYLREAIPVLDELISKRKQTLGADANKRQDLCTLDIGLLAQREGFSISDGEIRDNAITYFTLRAKMILCVLSWCLVWLTREPEAMEQVLNEINQFDDNKAVNFKDAPFLKAFIREVFRISPMRSRHSEVLLADNISFAGYDIPRGTMMASVPFLTHTDPEQFEDPFRFDASRFLRHEYSEQACNAFGVGGNFAIEWEEPTINRSVSFLATLLRHIKVEQKNLSSAPECAYGIYLPCSFSKATITPRNPQSLQEDSHVVQGA